MAFVRQQPPIDARVVVPFCALADLVTHEQQLLGRLAVHVAVERAQVRELLPPGARHLPQERSLAVHHLVVRQREHEVLVPGVEHPERDPTVVPLAMDGLLRHVLEGVVHPAHVPLEPESEPAHVERSGDHRPRGGLLRDGLHVRVLSEDGFVEVAKEADGLEVLPPTELVGDPLPLLARVVQVQHRRHGVDAQAVHVVCIEPVERAGHQERADLVASVVEDVALPVLVKALPGVLVLVQVRAVEVGEREPVRRKVGRHPVEDHTDATLVQVVHQEHEVLGRPEAAGGSKVARGLVTPGRVVGVLHDRQELQVGEAHLLAVVGQLRGHLPIAQPAVAVGRCAHPRAEVDLVDGHGGRERVAPAP